MGAPLTESPDARIKPNLPNCLRQRQQDSWVVQAALWGIHAQSANMQ